MQEQQQKLEDQKRSIMNNQSHDSRGELLGWWMEQQKLAIMNYNFYISGSLSIVCQALLILALHCTLDYLNIRNF